MRLRSLLSLRVLLGALAVSLFVSGVLVYIYARERTAAIAYVRAIRGIVHGSVQFESLPRWWPTSVPMPEWLRSVRHVNIGMLGRKPKSCDVGRIASLHEIERLTVFEGDDAGLQAIGRFEHLRHLNLLSSNLTDSGMSALRGCHRLQYLKLWSLSNKITDAGLEALDGLPLEYCELRSQGITGTGLRCLAHSPLQTLILNDTAVRDVGLSQLTSLPLTRLSLNGTAVTDDGLQALSELPLERLDLAHTEVTPRGVPALRAIKTLTRFSVLMARGTGPPRHQDAETGPSERARVRAPAGIRTPAGRTRVRLGGRW